MPIAFDKTHAKLLEKDPWIKFLGGAKATFDPSFVEGYTLTIGPFRYTLLFSLPNRHSWRCQCCGHTVHCCNTGIFEAACMAIERMDDGIEKLFWQKKIEEYKAKRARHFRKKNLD